MNFGLGIANSGANVALGNGSQIYGANSGPERHRHADTGLPLDDRVEQSAEVTNDIERHRSRSVTGDTTGAGQRG